MHCLASHSPNLSGQVAKSRQQESEGSVKGGKRKSNSADLIRLPGHRRHCTGIQTLDGCVYVTTEHMHPALSKLDRCKKQRKAQTKHSGRCKDKRNSETWNRSASGCMRRCRTAFFIAAFIAGTSSSQPFTWAHSCSSPTNWGRTEKGCTDDAAGNPGTDTRTPQVHESP